MSTQATTAPTIIDGLAAIADRYDAVILDLWGCVHNGVRPFPGAAEAMRRLRSAGRAVLLMSNAPRRSSAVAAGLERLGVARDMFDDLLASGEVTWQALHDRADPWYADIGYSCLHVGPERDASMLEGNRLEAVGIEDAGFVLVTGPRDDALGVDDHEDMLQRARWRGLKMVCANPDLEVIRGQTRLVCAGAIAERYRALGGDVRAYGKPFAAIYERAFAMLGEPPRGRVLAVGDGIHTDIAGALAAGIDSAFIPGGIHGEALGARMGERPGREVAQRIAAAFGLAPTYLLPELKW
jgi:HAD superfamily hydrolase (TIGR01459 family)